MSRDLILFAITLFTWGIGESMFFIFQPLYLQQLGASPLEIGTILGGMGFALAAAHIPAGLLSDRIGRRPLIWTAWFLGLTAAVVMALARSLPTFIGGMLLYNLTAFVSSPMNSYITAARGNLSIGRVLTFISAAYNAGAIIGPWLGGQIAEHYNLKSIYLISASIFTVSCLIIIFIRPQPVDRQEQQAGPQPAVFNPRLLIYLGVTFLAMFAMYLPQPLAPNYLQNERGLDYTQIGQLGSISGVGIVLLNLALGSLTARTGFLLGQAAMLAYTLLLWKSDQFGFYALAYTLLGGFRVARSLAIAQVRNLAHQSRMGLVYGINETVASSTVILAPPLAGLIYSHNPGTIFLVSAILILISLLVSARFLPDSTKLLHATSIEQQPSKSDS
jgi:DHA1 family multidrug resistance protein-like MFS transporter